MGLSSLTDAQREAVGSVLIEENYKKDDVIVRQGEVGDYFYIIAEGRVQIHKAEAPAASGRVSVIGKSMATLEVGQSFGETALLKNAPPRSRTPRRRPRTATCTRFAPCGSPRVSLATAAPARSARPSRAAP